ncbi:MAG: NTP transferase domain-containing protein [Chloroflexota bacterium]
MKAIILAAGRGSRLGHYTENLPKCMLQLGNRSILEHQISILRSGGINDIVIVKGFAEDKIQIPDIRYYVNNEHGITNMVYSLFCAEPEIDGELLISYGDILYGTNVLHKLLNASGSEVYVIVDKLWKSYYQERFGNPFDEAESLRLNPDGLIIDIGRSHPNFIDVQAQYIGLIKLSASGSKVFREKYHVARSRYSSKEWLRGRIFEKAYMTDFLQYLIDERINLQAVPIEHGWLEFDTEEDYEKVQDWIKGADDNRYLPDINWDK